MMIDVVEFGKIMAYIAAASQKPVSKETVAVYYDLLGDLPLESFRAAARSVCLSHKYATFPSVAELREAAISSGVGAWAMMPAQEAFAIAWRAAGKIDPDIRGPFRVYRGDGEYTEYVDTTAAALADVPEHVQKVMRTFGIARLIANNEPLGVLQAQFCQTYTALQLTAKRDAMLPQSLRDELARIGRAHEETEKDKTRPAPGLADQRAVAARGQATP